MKILPVFVCLAAIVAVAYARSATWGYRSAQDLWLSSGTAYSPAAPGRTTTVRVQFPPAGQVNYRIISSIFVFDKFTNSSGANPVLVSGGPGYKYATLNLISQYGKGVNSVVDIYGR